MIVSGLVSSGGSKGRNHLHSLAYGFFFHLNTRLIALSAHPSIALLSEPSGTRALLEGHWWQPCGFSGIISSSFYPKLNHIHKASLSYRAASGSGVPLEDHCSTCHMCGPVRWFGYSMYHSYYVEIGIIVLFFYFKNSLYFYNILLWQKVISVH